MKRRRRVERMLPPRRRNVTHIANHGCQFATCTWIMGIPTSWSGEDGVVVTAGCRGSQRRRSEAAGGMSILEGCGWRLQSAAGDGCGGWKNCCGVICGVDRDCGNSRRSSSSSSSSGSCWRERRIGFHLHPHSSSGNGNGGVRRRWRRGGRCLHFSSVSQIIGG